MRKKSRETKRDRKRRHLASRTALSVRNITEHAIAECAKVKDRNRNMKTNVLKTSKETLVTVTYVPPKEQQ